MEGRKFEIKESLEGRRGRRKIVWKEKRKEVKKEIKKDFKEVRTVWKEGRE